MQGQEERILEIEITRPANRIWLVKGLKGVSVDEYVEKYGGILVSTTDIAATNLLLEPGKTQKPLPLSVKAVVLGIDGDTVTLKIIVKGIPYTIKVPKSTVKPADGPPEWANPYILAQTPLGRNDVVEIKGKPEEGQYVIKAIENGNASIEPLRGGMRISIPANTLNYKGKWALTRVISDPTYTSKALPGPKTPPPARMPLPALPQGEGGEN